MDTASVLMGVMLGVMLTVWLDKVIYLVRKIKSERTKNKVQGGRDG